MDTSYRKRFEWAEEELCFASGYDEQKSGLVEGFTYILIQLIDIKQLK